jgi:hypothetical protein
MPAAEPASSRASFALRSFSGAGRRSLPLRFVLRLPVRDTSRRCRFQLRCRQQIHQPGISHVLQKLVAQFLNALIGIEGERLFNLRPLTPEIPSAKICRPWRSSAFRFATPAGGAGSGCGAGSNFTSPASAMSCRSSSHRTPAPVRRRPPIFR